MLKVTVPIDPIKVKKQIAALEYQIVRDTNDKDKQIHNATLNTLKDKMEVF